MAGDERSGVPAYQNNGLMGEVTVNLAMRSKHQSGVT